MPSTDVRAEIISRAREIARDPAPSITNAKGAIKGLLNILDAALLSHIQASEGEREKVLIEACKAQCQWCDAEKPFDEMKGAHVLTYGPEVFEQRCDAIAIRALAHPQKQRAG